MCFYVSLFSHGYITSHFSPTQPSEPSEPSEPLSEVKRDRNKSWNREKISTETEEEEEEEDGEEKEQ